MSIKVFKSEENLGIKDLILSNQTVSFEVDLPEIVVASEIESEDPHLFKMGVILASTGFNGNDDYFLNSELIKSNASSSKKIIDFEHDDGNVLGHIESSYFLDDKYNQIDEEDISENSIIHVYATCNINRVWQAQSRTRWVESIISKIKEKKYGVSLEARFSNFDYAVENKSGKVTIIEREEDTAFLSKNLRIFGGDGLYEGQKIGRVLRDYSYSGMGIVENPANKYSKVLSVSASKNTESKNEMDEQKVSELEKSLEEAKASIQKLTEENETLKASLEEKTETESALTKENEELKTSASEKDVLIKELSVENKSIKRTAQLVDAGVCVDECGSIIEEWASCSDEQFGKIVSLYSKTLASASEDETDEEEYYIWVDEDGNEVQADENGEYEVESEEEYDVEASEQATASMTESSIVTDNSEKEQTITSSIKNWLSKNSEVE